MLIGGYEIQVPFVTTSTNHLKSIIELADVNPGINVVDLGSGDGRIVLEFAKFGANVKGYEIRPHLVEKSKNRITDVKLQKNTEVILGNYWNIDLSIFEIIYIYGMKSILGRLEKKLERELMPGTKVISNIFKFPNWKVKKTKNLVHLYIFS